MYRRVRRFSAQVGHLLGLPHGLLGLIAEHLDGDRAALRAFLSSLALCSNHPKFGHSGALASAPPRFTATRVSGTSKKCEDASRWNLVAPKFCPTPEPCCFLLDNRWFTRSNWTASSTTWSHSRTSDNSTYPCLSLITLTNRFAGTLFRTLLANVTFPPPQHLVDEPMGPCHVSRPPPPSRGR